MEKPKSFEQIDAHVNKVLKSKAFAEGAPSARSLKALDPADVLAKVCTVYRGVRPILIGLAWIPFVPASWKKALATFQGVLDSLCPNG